MEIPVETQVGSNEPVSFPLAVTADGTLLLPRILDPYLMAFINPSTAFNASPNAQRFSDPSKKHNEGQIVRSVQAIFPQVNGLSVQTQRGSVAIFAETDVLPEKVYVGSLSSGLNKYLAILLCIVAVTGRIAIVDEVRNGFYYKDLAGIWTGIYELCKNNSTQIFATTHSWKCVRELLPVLTEHESEVCLLRTEKTRDVAAIRLFTGKDLRSAIEQGVEIR